MLQFLLSAYLLLEQVLRMVAGAVAAGMAAVAVGTVAVAVGMVAIIMVVTVAGTAAIMVAGVAAGMDPVLSLVFLTIMMIITITIIVRLFAYAIITDIVGCNSLVINYKLSE